MTTLPAETDDRNFRETRGRGACSNPAGRYERLTLSSDVTDEGREPGQVETEIYLDATKDIIARNDSPDVGFAASINPYRGCEHGCVYCFARPYHEYLGFSAGLDFETKIFAKPEAPALLRKALADPKWFPETLGMSGVTDPYQPVERTLGITRGCLEVLAECRQPVVVITKNHLVTRDIDLLAELARHQAVSVNLSITTLDPHLARWMEPRASTPERRFEAVRMLAEAGIPVSVLTAPIIPGLNDHEIPVLLERAADAGATRASYTYLRLPHGVKELFAEWLETHYPLKKEKILNRVREARGGKLYDAEWGTRMKGGGLYAGTVAQVFAKFKKRYGLDRPIVLSPAAFRRLAGPQLALL